MEVSIMNIFEMEKRIIDIFGDSFIKNLERKYGKIKNKNIPNYLKDIYYLKLHPFFFWWEDFKYSYERIKLTGKLTLNENSIQLLYLLDNLEQLRQVENFERILKDLKNPDKFSSTIFEANIAAGYKSLGFELTIPDETGVSGQPQNDFIINCQHQDVAIECKNIQNSRDQQICSKLTRILLNRIKETRRNIHIDITIEGKVSDKKLLSKIIEDVYKLIIKKGSSSEIEVQREGYIIRSQLIAITKIGNKSILNTIKEEYNPEFLAFDMILSKLDGTPEDISIVTLRRDIPDILTKTAINAINGARGQLPTDMPGVVHLGVPFEYTSKLIDFIDQVYGSLYTYLNEKTERISAIVTSSFAVDIDFDPPFKNIYHIIPSFKSRHLLSDNFKLLGSENREFTLNKEKFSIDTKFKIPVDINKSIQSIIFQSSSNDGRSQLRIWYRSEKCLRCEFINEYYERTVLEWDGDYEVGVTYRLNLFCATDSKYIFINGKEVCFMVI